MRHRICIVTTTRADYGLLFWLLRAVENDPELELSLYVTGSHLSQEFGYTVRQIEKDGFPIQRRIEILLSSDTPTATTRAMALTAAGFGDAFAEDAPSVVVVLGDRFEIVPVALAAVTHGIPVAHLHGGEISQGALDELFRHAVTKLATVHFPATELYRQRILQMGEDASRVHNFGAPGLDHLHHTRLLTRDELQTWLDMKLDRPTALVTYHPVTTEPMAAEGQIDALLAALDAQTSLQAIFTRANADAEGRLINEKVEHFCRERPQRFRLYDNLGSTRYLSCLKHLNLVVGNSSSGLTEAPSFARPVVNIGNRQRGRIMAPNVIQVDYQVTDINRGIATALSPEFQASLKDMKNPYDRFADGRVSERIAAQLKAFLREPNVQKKPFVDLPAGYQYG